MTDEDLGSLSQAKQALLERRMRGGRAPAKTTRHAAARGDHAVTPLSLAQEQLWYVTQLAPGNPAYSEAVTIRKRGAFDAAVFARAFNEIVRRHESWRTTFDVVDGQPVQRVHAAPVYELPVVDLRGRVAEDREHAAVMLAAEDSRRAYDLANGPLVRPRLVRLTDDEHRLYLSLHHLIFDGVSIYRVVLPEMITLYEAFAAGRPSPLAEPDVQYADYVAWEREFSGGAGAPGRLEYWKTKLDAAPLLQLPLDHPRPATQRFRGGMEPMYISRELADALRLLSRQTGATLFQVIASAFAVLLHHHSGQDDVVFGTSTDLRRRSDLETVVGYCLTPLVVRADLAGDPTFTGLLDRVRADLIDGLDHVVPFGQLVRELRPRREPGANPIFQAMVVLEPPTVAADASWSVHQMEVELGRAIGHAKFDLHFELDERPEGHIAGRLIYSSDLFTADTARRIGGHWHTLLAGIVADPERRISELNLLTAQERQQVLVDWNATRADYPRDATVHGLASAQVQRTPDAVAVVFGERCLTWRQLDDQAEEVARRLRGLGAGPGCVVALYLERSTDMVVDMLGVLKSGAAYLPLDPSHPPQRLAFMIEDSGAALLLTQSHLRATLPPHGATVVCIDDGADEPAQQPVSRPTPRPTSADVAYVMYTSGSTGAPKGVPISHAALVNLFQHIAAEPGMSASDTILAVTTYSFDVSVLELLLPLVTGATMVIAPHDVVADGRLLGRLIETSGATIVQGTPPTWQMLVDCGWRGSDRLVAWSGGDTLSPELAGWLAEHTAALWNLYGPTETTVWSTLARIRPGDGVTVGRPIANTRIYVLNERRQPVPVGVGGEVYIGGDGVAAGYLNRPQLTAERFVADPHVPGATMYRTGDQGRFLADGRLQHLGRLDQQLKIRGFRVEPGEIEVALQTHPRVAAAIVLARTGPDRWPRLVAYTTPAGDAPSAVELRTHLRGLLPDHMIPTGYVCLAAFPLTPNGKIDRKALPDPTPDAADARSAHVAPRTRLEARVAEIWARRLQLTDVSVEDDFFDLGGHSLLAVQLLVDIERELGLEIRLASFFEGSVTVAGLARIIAANQAVQAHERLTVQVQPQGTTPTLFFLHADESSMLSLRHFTRPLGSDLGLIALLPERVGRRFDRSRTIEDLATPMLAAIRQAQPHGPYLVAGYSFGGILAYEVVRRLLAANERVAWLGVLDAATPAAGARFQRQRLSVQQRIARQRRRGLRGAVQKSWEVLQRETAAALVRLGLRRSRLTDEFDWRGASAIVARYSCLGHDAPMDLFVTADRVSGTQSASLGWADVHRGPLTIHQAGGDHLAMVTEPHVSHLAELVSTRLREALRAAGQS